MSIAGKLPLGDHEQRLRAHFNPKRAFPPPLTWKNKPDANNFFFNTPSLCLIICLSTVLGPLQLVVQLRDAEGV